MTDYNTPHIKTKHEHIPRHWVHRSGITYHVKPYNRTVRVVAFKGHFDLVARQIAKEYYKKFRAQGMSTKEAKEKSMKIGYGTAVSIYRHKEAMAEKGK